MNRTLRLVAVPALVAAAAVPAVSVAAKDRAAKPRAVTLLVTAPAKGELLLIGSTFGGSDWRFSSAGPGSAPKLKTVRASTRSRRGRATVSLVASLEPADQSALSPALRVSLPVLGQPGFPVVITSLHVPYDAARDAVDVGYLRGLALPRLVRRALSKLIDASTGEVVWADER